MASEPKGKLEFYRAEIRDRPTAVYAQIYVKDEDGKIWTFHGAVMRWDLAESTKDNEFLKTLKPL